MKSKKATKIPFLGSFDETLLLSISFRAYILVCAVPAKGSSGPSSTGFVIGVIFAMGRCFFFSSFAFCSLCRELSVRLLLGRWAGRRSALVFSFQMIFVPTGCSSKNVRKLCFRGAEYPLSLGSF